MATLLAQQPVVWEDNIEGNREVLSQLASTLIDFELGFEILPGTKNPVQAMAEEKGPFKQDLRQIDP